MRTPVNPAAGLLFGESRARVLALLFDAPGESFFVRQIAREVETSVGAIQRELGLLAGAGLIKRQRRGNQVHYQVNSEHHIYPELRALVAKTVGVFGLLEAALAPLTPRINRAFVYGSVARGEDTASSDIDLMVIGEVSLDDVLEALTPLEKQLRRPINPSIYTLGEWKRRRHSGNHFLQSLKNARKVFLIGPEDESEKARGARVVQDRTKQSG